jgi:hypothetical protein
MDVFLSSLQKVMWTMSMGRVVPTRHASTRINEHTWHIVSVVTLCLPRGKGFELNLHKVENRRESLKPLPAQCWRHREDPSPGRWTVLWPRSRLSSHS